jgi:curved DNA-binding protein CbpA
MLEPCDILGVEAGASEAAIKAAFRRAAKRCHPDMNAGNRGGERRLRRLIAARDFLLIHGRRFSNRKSTGQRLRLGTAKDRRPFLFAGALTAVGLLLFIFLMPNAAAPSRSASAPLQPVGAEAIENSPIPDAESAEVKAIRDLRESTGARPEELRGLIPGGPAPAKKGTPGSVPRYRAPPLKKTVTQAAGTMTRTWRRFASTLGRP